MINVLKKYNMNRKEIILILIALISCITGIGYIGFMSYNMMSCNDEYVRMTIISSFIVGCFVGLGISILGKKK